MKKILFCTVLAVSSAFMCSCGSTWTITGNEMTIVKCDTDTIAPAGSFIMIPDTVSPDIVE